MNAYECSKNNNRVAKIWPVSAAPSLELLQRSLSVFFLWSLRALGDHAQSVWIYGMQGDRPQTIRDQRNNGSVGNE